MLERYGEQHARRSGRTRIKAEYAGLALLPGSVEMNQKTLVQHAMGKQSSPVYSMLVKDERARDFALVRFKRERKNDHNAADKNAFSHACDSVLKIQFPGCNGDLSGEMAEGVANYRLLEEGGEKRSLTVFHFYLSARAN